MIRTQLHEVHATAARLVQPQILVNAAPREAQTNTGCLLQKSLL
jgi:hypothetical protein